MNEYFRVTFGSDLMRNKVLKDRNSYMCGGGEFTNFYYHIMHYSSTKTNKQLILYTNNILKSY